MRHSITIPALLLLLTAMCPFPALAGRETVAGSVLGDSIAAAGEVFVLTNDQLRHYNINTLEDVLDMLPGVSYWSRGPSGSPAAFSVDGRAYSGVTLLVNGVPYGDPYNGLPLSRFVPLSRLIQVEVVFSSSPALTGRSSSGSIINLVIEEGGREGPLAVAEFTNGRSNRRSRRVWFSTPRSYLNFTLAYDEYLHDATLGLVREPSALIGEYDSRAILADLSLVSDDGHEFSLRFHRYEDTYRGTEYLPASHEFSFSGEDVRYSGFSSRLEYRSGRFSAAVGKRLVEMKRFTGWTSGLELDAEARLTVSPFGFPLRFFALASRATFENRIWDVPFEPEYGYYQGGATAGGSVPGSILVRAGVYGGYHDRSGGWIGGEAAFSRGDEEGFSQSLIVARRFRTPAAEELFQPELEIGLDGFEAPTSGNPDLDPGISDEIGINAGFRRHLQLGFFYREERNGAVLSGSPVLHYQEGPDTEVAGVRGRSRAEWRFLGMDWGYCAGGEYFGKRSDNTAGIPEFRAYAGVYVRRLSFKETEKLTLRFDSYITGESRWGAVELEGYNVHNISLSLTVMSAVVRCEMRNLFDKGYETVPGFWMPERHFRMGVQWYFFD